MWGAEFSPSQIKEGATTTDGIIISSNGTGSATNKTCGGSSKKTMLPFSSNSVADPTKNYIEIKCESGISTLSIEVAGNSSSSSGTWAVAFWNTTTYNSTCSSTTTLSISGYGSCTCGTYTSINVPSGTKMIRIYTKINVSGTTLGSGSSALGSGLSSNIGGIKVTSSSTPTTTDYYYRGEWDDNWAAKKMEKSADGLYWYWYTYASSNNRQFKITTGDNWDPAYGNGNCDPGFNCTDITNMTSPSSGWDLGGNAAVNYNNGRYYIIVFVPNTIINSSNSPKICASTSLPETAHSMAAEHKVYFDNTVFNAAPYFRRGRTCHNSADEMTKVNGTANLYTFTTTAYDNYVAYAIANNSSWTGENSIYKVQTGDKYAITKSTNYIKEDITGDLTIVPSTTSGTDQGCTYYNYTKSDGLLTHKATITAPSNGTITVAYKDINNADQSFTSGSKSLAHTCILTITATPSSGYKLKTLKVNNADFTSSSTYTLSADATIAATFEVTCTGPTINTHPSTTAVTVGTVGTVAKTALSVEATACSGSLSYQWYKNTSATATVDDSHMVSGATSALYTPAAESTAGDYYYYCKVTDSKGSVTSNVSGKHTWTPVTLSSISVKTAPTKVSYTAGEKFDPTDLVITKKMSDNTTADVAYAGHESDFTFSPDLNTALQTTDTKVTITYGDKSVEQIITVSASTYTVTYANGGGTGTMTDSNSPYTAGTEVTLLSNTFTAPDGKEFDQWSVKDANSQTVTVENGKFTMPASNVTVTATWKDKAPTPVGKETIFYYQWSGSNTIPSINDNLSAEGGTILVGATGSGSFSSQGCNGYVTGTPDDLKLGSSSDKKMIKFTASDSYFELTLTSGQFQTGDTIFFGGYGNFYLSSFVTPSKNPTHDIGECPTNGSSTNTSGFGYFVIPLKNGVDAQYSTIYVSRNSNGYFTAVKVVRPGSTPTTTWSVYGDFDNDGDDKTGWQDYTMSNGSVTIPNLPQNGNFKFKIRSTSDGGSNYTYYGAQNESNEMTSTNCTDWQLASGDDGKNINMTGCAADSYTFTYDAEKNDLDVTYPTSYTIAYAGDGATSGEMASQTCIASGEEVTLTTNAFQKTNMHFKGWFANVAVKINGSTVTAGTLISDGATLQQISSDITLTAQWETVCTAVAIHMENNEHKNLEVGETNQLYVTYTPESPEYGGEVASWESANTAILTIDDGLVTAKGAGTTTITVTTTNGKTNTYNITVNSFDCTDWFIHAWNGNNIRNYCMHQEGADGEWRTDEVRLPSASDDEKITVLKVNDNPSLKADWNNNWVAMVGQQKYDCKHEGKQYYAGHDALGYYRILTNSNTENYALAFQPTYVLIMGKDITNASKDNPVEFIRVSGENYQTPLVQIPNGYKSDATYKYYVGTKRHASSSNSPFIWDGKSSVDALNGVTGLKEEDRAGQFGKFDINADWCDANFYCTFIPYDVVELYNNGSLFGERQSSLASSPGKVVFSVPEAPTGYDFGGWQRENDTYIVKQSDADWNNYEMWKSYERFNAVWTPQTYSITYKDQGGSDFSGNHESDHPTTYTYGVGATLKSATKTGYEFGGWFIAQDCSGSAVTSIGTDAHENKTFYAKWTATPSPVSSCYETNYFGDATAGATITYSNCDKQSTYAKIKSSNGYAQLDFVSPFALTDGTTDAGTITVHFSSGSSTSKYTLTLYVNGSQVGTYQTNGTTGQCTATYNIPLKTTSISSIKAAQNGSSGIYLYDISVCTHGSTPTTHTVTLQVADGQSEWGTISPSSLSAVADGTSISIDGTNNKILHIGTTDITATPTKATAQYTYGFSEWSWTDNVTTVTKDITATATFTRTLNKYDVTFDLQGHGSAIDKQTIDYNGTVTKPTDPTATGYTFGGWYKENACTNAWNFSTDKVTGTTTLYAKWTQQTEGACYEIGDGTEHEDIPYGGGSFVTTGCTFTSASDIVKDERKPYTSRTSKMNTAKIGSSAKTDWSKSYVGGTCTADISSMQVGVCASGTNDFAILFSKSGDFSGNDDVSVKTLTAHDYSDANPTIQSVTIPTGGYKAFRIYRAVTINGTQYGSSSSCYVYYIKVCTGSSACAAPVPSANDIETEGLAGMVRFTYTGSNASNMYWQTSEDGTNTNYPATGSRTVAGSGNITIYLRGYDSTNDCWSTPASKQDAPIECAAPVITSQPSPVNAVLNEEITLTVETEDDDDTYQWYACNADGSNQVMLMDAIYNQHTFTTVETGTFYYVCKVKSSCGWITSSNVIAAIIKPAKFTVHYTMGADGNTAYNTTTFTANKERNAEVEGLVENLTGWTFKDADNQFYDNGQKSSSSKGYSNTMSALLNTRTAEPAADNEIISLTFDIAQDYQIGFSEILLPVAANTGKSQNFRAVLSDAYGHSITGNITNIGELNYLKNIGFTLDPSYKLVGTITLKLYAWHTSDAQFRLGKDVYISGEVTSLPEPELHWTTEPENGIVGSTMTVAAASNSSDNTGATITYASDFTAAASVNANTGLLTYKSAETNKVNISAHVTGDGIHYTSVGKSISKAITVSADVVKYSIEYRSNGSSSGATPVDANHYLEGDKITVMGNTGSLVKTGYKFNGWNTATNGSGTHYDVGDEITVGTSDIVLYAEWNNNVATGISVTPKTLDLKVGTNGNLAAALTPAGCEDETILWISEYTTAATVDGDNKSAEVTTVAPRKSFKIYAKTDRLKSNSWYATVSTYYEINYDVTNGGTASKTTDKYYEGELTLPTISNIPTGKAFTGWWTAKTDGTFIGLAGATYTPSGNVTIYAQYEDDNNEYDIAYELNGGTCSTKPETATVGTAFQVGVPTLNGHTFTGWTVSSGLVPATAKWGTSSTPATAIADASTLCINGNNNVYFKDLCAKDGEVTLTANWKENCSGGGGSTETVVIWDGSSLSDFATSPDSKTGLTWAKGSSWEMKIGDKDYAPTYNEKIYTNQAKIGSAGSGDNQVIAITIPSGYTGVIFFTGITNSSGNERSIFISKTKTKTLDESIAYISSSSTTVASAAQSSSLSAGTYYICATASVRITEIKVTMTPIGGGGAGGDCYYVTYDGNGATGGNVQDMTAYTSENNTVIVKANNFEKSGYTFNGWKDQKGTSHAAGSSFTISEDMILTAQWKEAEAGVAICWNPADDVNDQLASGTTTLTKITSKFTNATVTIEATPGTGTNNVAGSDDNSGFLKVKDCKGVKIIKIVTTQKATISLGGEQYGSNTGSFYLVDADDEKVDENISCTTGSSCTYEDLPMGTYYVYALAKTKSINFSKLCITTGEIEECTDPAIYDVSGSAMSCDGTNETITLSNSETDVTYVLRRNGTAVEGSDKTGTGSALTWVVPNSGTYTVSGTRGLCVSEMNGEAVLTVPSAEIVNDIDGATVAINTAVTLSTIIKIDDVENAGDYSVQWFRNSVQSIEGATAEGNATTCTETETQQFEHSVTPTTAGTTYYFARITTPCNAYVYTRVVAITGVSTSLSYAWTLDGNSSFSTALPQGGKHILVVTASAGEEAPTIEVEEDKGITLGTITTDGLATTAELLIGTNAEDFSITASTPVQASYAGKTETKNWTVRDCAGGSETILFDMYLSAYNTAVINPDYGGALQSIGFSNTDKATIDGHTYYKANQTLFKLTLKSGVTIQAGDQVIMKVTSSKDTKDCGFIITKGSSTTKWGEVHYDINHTEHEMVYTVPANSSMIGQSYFGFQRYSSDTYVYGLSIVRGGGSGDISTTIEWVNHPGTTVQKTVGASDFTFAAQPASTNKSTGTIEYTSSDPAKAVVNADGTVHIMAAGNVTISAKQSAVGCYMASNQLSYNLEIAEATCEDHNPYIVMSGDSPKCPDVEVVLTATKFTDGATLQWYKDGVAISGKTESTLTLTAAGVYHVVATKTCALESNAITIENNASGSAIVSTMATSFTVRGARPFSYRAVKIAQGSTYSITSNNTDLQLTLAPDATDANIIRIEGTGINTAKAASDVTITVYAGDDGCTTEATHTISITQVVAGEKNAIAWVTEGTGGGTWDATTAAKSTDVSLYKYLQQYYEVTAVNNYHTTKEAELIDFYSQFDLLLMTDYPDSKKGGYTNAFGLLIDTKPILSFEAFVANCSNWGIDGTPHNTAVTQTDLTLLCNADDIFGVDNKKFAAGTAHTLTSVADGQGLQGFLADEAPDFTMIGKITDDAVDYIACMERQVVPENRMMIFGLNSNTMDNMTSDGEEMVQGFIEYLLLNDPASIPDCSVIFHGYVDENWDNDANWENEYKPSKYATVRIDAPCKINVNNAYVGNMKIHTSSEGSTYTGKVTIPYNGALTVLKSISRIVDSKYTVQLPTTVDDIEIQSSAEGTGSLAIGAEEGTNYATTQFFSKAYRAYDGKGNRTAYWQYMGTTVYGAELGIDFAGANTYLFTNGGWKREYSGIMKVWGGYGVSQDNNKLYTMQGLLQPTKNHTYDLNYGENLVANSWTAPIRITDMETSDFVNAAPTIYIYNTGHDGGTGVYAEGATKEAGQWQTIPVNTAKLTGWEGPTVIPVGQAFQVNGTSSGAKLKLDYGQLVMPKEETLPTTPAYAPGRRMAPWIKTNNVDMMRIRVMGSQLQADLYLLESGDFNEGYDRGWDGDFVEGDGRSPMFYSISNELGNMAINALPDLEGRQIGFVPNNETTFTISFWYDGFDDWYFNDIKMQTSTLITSNNIYRFTSADGDDANRFYISKTPLQKVVPTGAADLNVENQEKKIIYKEHMYLIHHGRLFDGQGKLVR